MDREAKSGFLTKEKLLGMHRHPNFKWVVLLVIFVLFLDLAFLNYKILFAAESFQARLDQEVGLPTTATEKDVKTLAQAADNCGPACQNQINKAVGGALTAKSAVSGSNNTSNNSSQVQEYFVPLGAGVVSSTSWQTIQGLQATIDGNAYGSIQTVTFEISVNVPTGNETANFQLYNSTLNHPVWFSNVTFTGGSNSQLLVSSPITLDSGSNLYTVQAQTQLQYPAYITQARVHIITN